jgi:hypothetical protein
MARTVITRKVKKTTPSQETAPEPAPVAEPEVHHEEASVASEETEHAESAAATSEETEQEGSATKTKRPRARTRPYDEILPEFEAQLKTAYDALREARKLFTKLNNSHRKSVSSSRPSRKVTRRPSIVFHQPLIDYLRSKLTADELKVERQVGDSRETVSLADLDTTTRVHRTDVTQLLSKVYEKHQISNEKDRRKICYERDPDLVSLLVDGDYDPQYQSDVEAIKAGTHELNIFNVQRLLNRHLGAVDLSKE